MLLYLIRHAEAAGHELHATDEERPLTAEGQAQTKRLAAALHRHGLRPDVILCSPLVRTRQTAEGLLAGWKSKGPKLRKCAELAPGGDAMELAEMLAEVEGDVALVGHNPDLEEHLAWLLGSKKVRLAMAKAAVACLRCEPPVGKGCAVLLWLVTPEWVA